MPAPSVHLKIKIAVTVRRGISKRSHETIGDCEQSRKVSTYRRSTGSHHKGLYEVFVFKLQGDHTITEATQTKF